MKKLTTEELSLLIQTNPCNFGRMIKSRHREFYDFIDANFKGSRFPEKLYRYIWEHDWNLWIKSDKSGDCPVKPYIEGHPI